MAARNAIETADLTKRYGTLTALDNVTFEVARGELFGLIGPDGAGKTTLFRLLTTLINPVGGFRGSRRRCRSRRPTPCPRRG